MGLSEELKVLQQTLVIDFDSTFCKLEALDELARIALEDTPDRQQRLRDFQAITTAGMEGAIGFHKSLTRRLKLLSPTDSQIEQVISLLKANVTLSFVQHKEDIRKMTANLYIISGGFKEFILPVVEPFDILPDHVLANTFTRDGHGRIIGYDTHNPLSQDDGKVKAIRALDLPGRVVMVGDGYGDYRIKQMGAANEFVAFIENVRRQSAVAHADAVASDFGAILDFCYSVKA